MSKRTKKDRFITRTICTTVCEVYGINVETRKMEVHICEVSGKMANEDEAVQACKEKYASVKDEFVPCVVMAYRHKEKLYRIPESVFLKYAEPVENDTPDNESEVN